MRRGKARAGPDMPERFCVDAYWHPALRHSAEERVENLA